MARRRSRTTFTVEQKQRMEQLAHRVGWGLKKRDEAIMEEGCCKIGVDKERFRFWMRNHKSDLIGGGSTDGGLFIARGPAAAITACSVGTTGKQSWRRVEFFKVLMSKSFEKALLVPPTIAKVFGSPREFEVHFAWGKTMKSWPVKASVDEKTGHMYLRDGWAMFVHANKMRLGDFLVFSYFREAGVLRVKVFDTTCCRRIYPDGGLSGADLQ